MMRRSTSKPRNQRISNSRQRRQQHLLDVKVRSRKATEQRNQALLLWGCRLLVVGALTVALLIGGRAALRKFLWQNKEFQISEIQVNIDGSLTRDEILKSSRIQMGENIFAVKLSEAHDRLARLPQVEHVEIQRGLPNRISIDVEERHPVAWITSADAETAVTSSDGLLVDAEGTVMRAGRMLPEYLRLPLICGVQSANLADGQTVDLPELHAAIELLELNGDNARLRIRNIDLSKGYCLMVNSDGFGPYTFPLDHLSDELERFNIVYDNAAKQSLQIQTVNLLVQRNLPVTYAPIAGMEPEGDGKAENKATAKSTQKSSTSAVDEKPTAKQNAAVPKTRAKAKAHDEGEPKVRRAVLVKRALAADDN